MERSNGRDNKPQRENSDGNDLQLSERKTGFQQQQGRGRSPNQGRGQCRALHGNTAQVCSLCTTMLVVFHPTTVPCMNNAPIDATIFPGQIVSQTLIAAGAASILNIVVTTTSLLYVTTGLDAAQQALGITAMSSFDRLARHPVMGS